MYGINSLFHGYIYFCLYVFIWFLYFIWFILMVCFFNIEHFSSPYKPCVLVLIHSAFRQRIFKLPVTPPTRHYKPLPTQICYMDFEFIQMDSSWQFQHFCIYCTLCTACTVVYCWCITCSCGWCELEAELYWPCCTTSKFHQCVAVWSLNLDLTSFHITGQ